METKLNVTKGVASLEVRKAHILLHVGENNKTKNVADIWFTEETRNNGIADAKLIRDAFNTHNTTGYTPSQLLEQNRELVEALRGAIFVMKDEGIKDWTFYDKLLSKHSKDV